MCDYRTWVFLRHHSNTTTTTLRKMLKCYLWLMLCLQFALINAARIRRGSAGIVGDEQEHIHIKVHIPDITRMPTNHYKLHQNHHKPNVVSSHGNGKKTLTTVPLHGNGNGNDLPYEFDFYGMGDSDNSLLTASYMDNNKFGPMIFSIDGKGTTLQQPMSQQFMRQLFSPEILSALRAEHGDNDLNNSNGGLLQQEEETSLDNNDLMQEYFQKLNPKTKTPKLQTSTRISVTAPTREVHKRKKYGNFGIGEDYPKETLQQQFYNTILKEQNLTPQRNLGRNKNQQRYQQRQRQQQHHQQLQQSFNNFNAFEDDSSAESDELEAAENNSATTTSASNEDMSTAFNGLYPISYQDMYGEYATPITASTSTATSSTRQQHGFGYHEILPTYTSTISTPHIATNSWLQYHQQQEAEQQQRPKLQQYYYKPRQQQQHYQQQKYVQQKKSKSKSQQTQFVLQPPTSRLASSSSLSSSISLSPTSPISTGFGGSGSGSSNINSPSTWTIPYDFVQQSHQQQLDAQQYPKQQKLTTTSYKKRKNRTKRKRNRIIVE